MLFYVWIIPLYVKQLRHEVFTFLSDYIPLQSSMMILRNLLLQKFLGVQLMILFYK